MRIDHDDNDTLEYLDNAAMSYMALMTHSLNYALRENAVADVQTRRKICTTFLFDFSYRHGAGWLWCSDRKLFPLVSFAERANPAERQNLGVIDAIHIPTPASSWYEYTHGVVAHYFEDNNETVTGIRSGSYDIED
jgi:hypothetical protein